MLTCARSSVRFRQRRELEGSPLALKGPEGVLGDHPAEHTGREPSTDALFTGTSMRPSAPSPPHEEDAPAQWAGASF